MRKGSKTLLSSYIPSKRNGAWSSVPAAAKSTS